LSSSWWRGRRGSGCSWWWWPRSAVEGSTSSFASSFGRPWWSLFYMAGLGVSSALCRSCPAVLSLAGRSWWRGARGGKQRHGRVSFFRAVLFNPGAPTWRLVVLFAATWRAFLGRQAVWVLKTVPPLNNVQLLFSLILDRGSSIFLPVGRGG
jgi:hypothetical protein